MRVGMNPQKKSKKLKLKSSHRLIIVVFIPSLEGYYKNVLEVFKLCLESAIVTTNSNCAITVVNNASCAEVTDYLKLKLDENKIDTVVYHKNNIGKIDALIGAARASREPLITISDVDILYKLGWQNDVEDIFEKVKDVASVSPIPCRQFYNYETSSTMSKILMGKVKFKAQVIPENHEDQNRYLDSFNWEREEENVKWPTIKSNGIKAIMGSGHQVLSMRRALFFESVPLEPSFTLVGNYSEGTYCDKPINNSGGMRLATYFNRAYHMGNQIEPWMEKVQNYNLANSNQTSKDDVFKKYLPFHPKRRNRFWYPYTSKLSKILFNIFYRYKL
ncbi:glycosyltransferase family 2 protein [Winogradskyella sp. DF17]|uniref:Glycosyltransferase family 2 protein n=1 Tax=Winogradskyella pelagia TaxID=2819984 RepID=A0ABS3T2L4_9FLAO|nr:glycosyltransferase [Winogradskyella sp. DF17]MBO3116689.1 glycosyltransferase family 2 protein [Winogradskyella sp. DF17]